MLVLTVLATTKPQHVGPVIGHACLVNFVAPHACNECNHFTSIAMPESKTILNSSKYHGRQRNRLQKMGGGRVHRHSVLMAHCPKFNKVSVIFNLNWAYKSCNYS